MEAAHVYNQFLTVEFIGLADFAGTATGRWAVKEFVTDLGDAAYLGPDVKTGPYILAFRMGNRGVRISSDLTDEAGNRVVPNEKLREVADLIESRLE